MNSIDEDKVIWDVFDRVIDLGTKLNQNMWVGEKESIRGKKKKPISVEKIPKYKNQLEREEEKLTHLLIKLNRIEIRKSEDRDHVKDLKNLRQFYFALEDVLDDLGKEIIEYHITEGLIDRDLFFENYYSLDPPYVKKRTYIPPHINRLCQESRWCYVYERYNAAIVLSRAIIETILKNKLGYEVDSFKKLFCLIKDAKEKTNISNKVADGAHCIRELANNIVHQGNSMIEKKEGKCPLNSRTYKVTDEGTLEETDACTLEGWAECTLKEKAKCTLDFILVFLDEIYFKSNENI